MPDFLLEIGCEEIPARMIDAASAEFAKRVGDLIKREDLGVVSPVVYSTPRRLAISAAISPRQPDSTSQSVGPSVAIAYADGKPTKAAEAFAKKVGVKVDELEVMESAKGKYIFANLKTVGRSASEVLAESLSHEIGAISWPKSMYWRSKNERFIRPVRWLVAMLDDQIIPMEFAGIRAGGESYGHRMLGRKVTLKGAKEYESALERVSVVARRESREQRIRKALDAATRAVSGAKWREDAKLLDTVVSLTEWPSVVMGNFDGEFLALPEEVLVTVMRDHQKYFAVEDREGKLAPHFLAVLNTDGDPQGIIRHGHERVLRARFNDARFFWNTDQKITLRCRVDLLKQVTFQKDLGSYYDKTLRVQRLASWLSETVKQAGIAVRPGIVHKAALLAKADLTSELVKEFTELQGVVGGLYAKAQGLDPAIGDAIYDHYKPESMDDAVPRTMEGAMLSIADKADSIAGMFALGLQPTGSKDPFALRRQANGIVRIIAEKKLPIGFHDLFYSARATYVGSAVEARFKKREEFFADLNIFFKERLTFYLREVGGFAYDVVNAVLEAGADDVVDAVARAQAVQQVREMADFQSIGMACKRIRNILRQSHEKGITPAAGFDESHEEAPEAKMLHAQLERMIPRVKADRGKKRYLDALHQLATLREPVDKLFDRVMVMVDDERVRANRLALLQRLLNEFSTIADFSEIVTEGKSST